MTQGKRGRVTQETKRELQKRRVKNSRGNEDTEEDEVLSNETRSTAMVPSIRVCLLQTVKVLPCQSRSVLVKLDGSGPNDPLLLEYDETIKNATGLQVEDTLLSPSGEGLARLVVTNRSEFTQVATEGDDLGGAARVTIVHPAEEARAQVYVVSGEVKDKQARVDQLRCKKVYRRLTCTSWREPSYNSCWKTTTKHLAWRTESVAKLSWWRWRSI